MTQIYPTKDKLVKPKYNMVPLSVELYEELVKEYTKQEDIWYLVYKYHLMNSKKNPSLLIKNITTEKKYIQVKS